MDLWKPVGGFSSTPPSASVICQRNRGREGEEAKVNAWVEVFVMSPLVCKLGFLFNSKHELAPPNGL